MSIIKMHIPKYQFIPTNYIVANANIIQNYKNCSYYSSSDRCVYIITNDPLVDVINNIDFKSNGEDQDYSFEEVQLDSHQFPDDTLEWIEGHLKSVKLLQDFLGLQNQDNL